MPKIYDFDKYRISVFSDTIIQIKRKFKKWQISIDANVDVTQKLPKCLAQNLILCLSSLHRENPMIITMYIT